jgi:hypothetical protein
MADPPEVSLGSSLERAALFMLILTPVVILTESVGWLPQWPGVPLLLLALSVSYYLGDAIATRLATRPAEAEPAPRAAPRRARRRPGLRSLGTWLLWIVLGLLMVLGLLR